MRPILFYLGSWPVYSYSFMLVLAFIMGIALIYRKLKIYGITFHHVVDVILLAIIGAIFGSRLWFILQYLEQFGGTNFSKIFIFWDGGLVFHGGLICSVFFIAIYAYRHHWPMLAVADIFTMGVALGIGFGRLGCFLYGCCYGIECSHVDSIWAVQYPAYSIPAQQVNLQGINIYHLWVSYAPSHLHSWVDDPQGHIQILHHLKDYLPPSIYADIFRPIYATQLMASAQGFLLCLGLLWYYSRRRYDGEMVLFFFIFYGCFRFSIELLRTNPPVLHTGFTEGQLFGIIVFLFCAALWLKIELYKKIMTWKKRHQS